jgi:hypothetical protein
MILRNIYRTHLHDSSSSDCPGQAEVDERIANAILQLDDPEIVLDLRQMNGKPNCSMFNKLWEKLQL